jgi:demethylmenaquinone methyltransferase/2-methoxy-6-polyprenyl-1,4-benzoquinol methylase
VSGSRPQSEPLLDDYSRQALTYDRSRAADGPLTELIDRALRPAPGPRLIDIGGGTGNYAAALAARGWRPLVADISAPMLERAAAKGLATLRTDAQDLAGVEDASFDAALMFSMLHHLPQPDAAIAAASRALVPGGRLAMLAFSREDGESVWLADYFPSSAAWVKTSHMPRSALVALLPGCEQQIVTFSGEDMNLASLAGRPELVLDAGYRAQTSYFERLARDDPRGLDEGLARLAHDLAAGRAPRRPGTATLLSWTRP